MSKNNKIEEVTLISDDEDEPVPTKQTENVVETTTSSTMTTKDKREENPTSNTNKFAILKETLAKPTLISNDADSDCEITEIPIEKPKEIPKEKVTEIKSTPVVIQEPEPVASTSKCSMNYKSIESDEEITEILVIDKNTNTKKSEVKMDVDKTEVKINVDKTEEEKVKEVKIQAENKESVDITVEKIENNTSEVTASNGKRMKCCNTDCAVNGHDFIVASSFMKAFYAVNELKDQIHRICGKCVTRFEEYSETLQGLIAAHKPHIDAAHLIPKRDTVVLEDSDDEMEADGGDSKETDSDDIMYEIDLAELQETIESAWSSLNLEEQKEMCETKVEADTDKLQLEMDDLNTHINLLQNKLDSMRQKLYAPWCYHITELPALDIIDVQNASAEEEEEESAPVAVATKSTTTPYRTPRVVAMKKVTQMRSPSSKSSEAADILDLGEVDHRPAEPLPPAAPLERPLPKVGQIVYAMKSTLFMDWIKAKVIEIGKNEQGEVHYKVKFLKQNATTRWLLPKCIAYSEPPKVQLTVGTRIIAVFHNLEDESNNTEDGNKDTKKHYYAGIIAEQLKTINRHRYLVFFDDGFTQYVNHSKVCVVVSQSRFVWEDCHSECQDFTRTYVTQFPERPMVKLQVGQVVKTEWNTRWWLARVRKIDCSLVLVHFDADGRTEWIYRGSTRLGPLYSEMAKKTERQKKGLHTRAHRSFGPSTQRVNQPFVEYTRGESENTDDISEELSITYVDKNGIRRNLNRSVAKKSTGGRQVEGILAPPPDRKENVGIVQRVPECVVGNAPRFRPHQCTSNCIGTETFREGNRVLQNPMLIPILHGWARECCRLKERAPNRSSKTHRIYYVGPCGRRLRTMQDIQRYLRLTESNLGIDLFCTDPEIQINTEFVVPDPLYQIKDISYGKENVIIPCVNTINHYDYPAYVEYATKRIPTPGVQISNDPGFLVCCDCKDGCQNKNKCACHKLTLEMFKDKETDREKLGYSYRRLGDAWVSAIYECNSQCKCNETCFNRVVQHPMKVQLQLFKTEKRGWGIRALNDIPRGTFLCIYAGQLLTENQANEFRKTKLDYTRPEFKQWYADVLKLTNQKPKIEEGKTYGDEYLAELDYIEVTEREKEDYESDITDIEESDSEIEDDIKDSEDSQDCLKRKDNDTDFTVDSGVTSSLGEPMRSMTLRQRNKEKNKKKEEAENSTKTSDSNKKLGEVKAPRAAMDSKKSVRYLFDGTEDIYVMDAKGIGNIGRYFNHSCDPNVIVRNVFVDTHDVRYPWVAFFTSRFAKAGTELCWNYNYEIGSLPHRRLECYCESRNCKGRLL